MAARSVQKTKRQGSRRGRATTDDGGVQIYGFHAVAAALANPQRPINQIWLSDNARHRLRDLIEARQPVLHRCRPAELDKRLGADTVHQGVLMDAGPLPFSTLDTLIGEGPIIILDQVTDPHNVGAVLRSAAAFGAAGLVMTRRHSPPLAGALAKSASGALELVPVALVQNLARALSDLKASGVRLIGFDGDGDALFEDLSSDGPIGLVLGAEGRGLRASTKAGCDKLCRLLTAGPLDSLNVSNAAAVGLHHLAVARRREAQRS